MTLGEAAAGQSFPIIYADPPWSFSNKNTGGSMSSGSANQYDVMSVKDICDLPIPLICEDNAVLCMWWVASQPREALAVVDAWGFKLKTMTGFVWNKVTTTGLPFFGMGFQTRQGTENVITAYKGNQDIFVENMLIAMKGTLNPIHHSQRAVVTLPETVDGEVLVTAPAEKHSKKPDIFRDLVKGLYGPTAPAIELFARQKSEGWTAWGNEI